MRVLRAFGAGAFALGFAVVGIIAWAEWDRAHWCYPTPDKESSFLRAYELKPVVQPFMAPNQSSSEGWGSGGSAGRKSATSHRSYEEHLVVRSDQKEFLLLAVRDDVSHRLFTSRARILNQYGMPLTGFHFDYTMPNTVGSVAIHPLAPGGVLRNMPLSDGLEDVTLEVAINEEWYQKGLPEPAAALAKAGN